jgi:type II secretory pathway component GspD/PulD (secretin)
MKRNFLIFFLCCSCLLLVLPVGAADKDSLIVQALDKVELNKEEPLIDTTEEPLKEVVPSAAPGPVNEIPAAELKSLIDVLEFNNVDIRTALKVIEEKSGLSISVDADVQGKVETSLENIDLEDALKIILETNNLAYTRQDRQIRVMTADQFRAEFGRNFAENIKTRIIPLKYADVSDVSKNIAGRKGDSGKIFSSKKPAAIILMDSPKILDEIEAVIKTQDVPIETEIFDLKYSIAGEVTEAIKKQLSANLEQIRADERANKIVVTDTAANIQEVGKIVKELDKKKEIEIQAKIVRIELSDEYESGVDWEAIVAAYQSLKSNGGLEAAGKRDLSIGTVSAEDFLVLVDALDLCGDMETFTISGNDLQNNDKNLLRLTADGNEVTLSVISPFLGKELPAAKLGPKSVDVSFMITPVVHLDNSLTLNVTPVSDGPYSKAALTIKSGENVVLGGIFNEEHLDRTKKFPLLGNIPFVGVVFRSRTTDLLRTEFVVILIPQVIETEAQNTTVEKVE